MLPCWGAGADPFDDMDTDEPTPRARPQLEVRCDVDDLTRRRLQARFRDGVKVVSALAEAERAKRAAQIPPPPASRLSRSLAATATSMSIPGHMNPRMAQRFFNLVLLPAVQVRLRVRDRVRPHP